MRVNVAGIQDTYLMSQIDPREAEAFGRLNTTNHTLTLTHKPYAPQTYDDELTIQFVYRS